MHSPIMDQDIKPTFTRSSRMDEAKLIAMEIVMLQTAKARETGKLDIDAIIDEQVDFWNSAWKRNFMTDTMRAAMTKFQTYKDNFTSLHPLPTAAENSPIFALIGCYRQMLVNGEYLLVFAFMLLEAAELYRQFGVNDTLQLDCNLSIADNDAVLANYVVATTVLACRKSLYPSWIDFASWCKAEIGLREQNGIWSGPTNRGRLSPVISQSLATGVDNRKSSAPAQVNSVREGVAPPEGNDPFGPGPTNLFVRGDEAEELSRLPAKRRREEEKEVLEVYERPDKPAKTFRESQSLQGDNPSWRFLDS